jgi:hypothetical protein
MNYAVPGMLQIKSKPTLIALSIVAAVLYNIWILGFVLDFSSLQNSYFSILDVYGKPYAWLFITSDILTAIIVILVGLSLKATNKPSTKGVAVGYIFFGIATFIEALIPISNRCEARISACGISLGQVLSPHDIASIVAALSLFYVLLIRGRQLNKGNLDTTFSRWMAYSFWLFCFAGIFLIVSVVINNFTVVSQAMFLVACGNALVAIPLSVLNLSEQ